MTIATAPQTSPGRDFFGDRWRAIARFNRLFAAMQRLERRSTANLSRMDMLLLTTAGRTSGAPRTTTLTYISAPAGDGLVVGSRIRGERSDWYRNLLVQPEVTVQVGSRTFAAQAETVRDPHRRREFVAQLAQRWDRNERMTPRPVRWLMGRLMGADPDRFLREDLEHADELPCVVLTPRAPAPS